MKKQIIKTLGIAVMMAMSSLYVSAQMIHEFSVYGGGGLSALRYDLSSGDRSGRMGGDFGVGYTFINGNWQAAETGRVENARWGLHTGIGFGLYNAKANLNNVTATSSNLTDEEGDRFRLNTTLKGYSEIQNAFYLNIPVMGVYQTEIGSQTLYGMGGIKFGIPIGSKFKANNTTLENEADYYEFENKLTGPQFAGYGNFNKSFDGDVGLGFCLIFALEGGAKWRISENLSIYTGLYFDYGLNNASKESYKDFINYSKDKPADFTTNSVLTSYSKKSEAKIFTEKIHLIAVGIKVRVAIEK